MKNKEIKNKGIEADFREVKEMNENEVDEMTNNEETGVEEAKNTEESEEWTMEDLKEARRIRKVKKVLKKIAIGVTGVAIVTGATILVVKKMMKGETVDIDAVTDDEENEVM